MERRPRSDNRVGVNVFFFLEFTLQVRGLPGFFFTGLVLGVAADFFRLARFADSLGSADSDDDQSKLSSSIASASLLSLSATIKKIEIIIQV